MAFNLMTIFKNSEFQKFGQAATNVVELAFRPNKKTGARIVRAVLDDGRTLVKTVTASGAVIEEAISLPAISSAIQRNKLIKELSASKKTQEQIAAMLNISQATVSNVLKKK